MAFARSDEPLFARTALPSANYNLPASREAFRHYPPKSASGISRASRPKLTIDTSVHSAETVERFRAKLQFMKTFREFSAAGQRRKWRERLQPQLEYLSEIHRNNLKPESAFFCSKSSPRCASFQEFSLGDSYASAISVAISKSPSLESLNFKNNRLREIGSLRIIETLHVSASIRELNLSENRLGQRSVAELVKVLQTPRCSVEVLALERSLVQREHANMLLAALHDNKSLRVLNLARNELSTVCAKALRAFLVKNGSVEILDLHWNTLNGPAAVQLFAGLAANGYVKVLDLSWNSLGRSSEPEVCQALNRMFRENQSLLHLDLSSNYFTFQEATLLAEGIKVNHSILGMHLDGNDMEQDAMGFILPVRNKRKDIESHMSPRMMSDNTFKSVLQFPKHCWICNKWQDANFVWNTGEVAWSRRLRRVADEHRKDDEPILLHLDIDDYRPTAMDHCLDGSYQIARAIPYKGVRFFFTYRGSPQISSAYSVFALEKPMEKEVEFDTGVSKLLSVTMLNEMLPMGKVCCIEEDFPVEARKGEWIFRYPVIEIEPTVPEWKLENSTFKSYRLDSEAVLRECLESDLAHTKIPTLFKSADTLTKVKATLTLAYKHLKEAFRYFCNFDKFQAFKLTLSGFTDLANMMKLVDGKTLRIGDLDTDIKASASSTESGSQNIAAITRNEFVEAMVRIAIDKFHRTQICKTEAEALEKLVFEHLLPNVPMLESDKWRYARYLKEEIDALFVEHEPHLQKAFSKFSGRNSQFGDRPWMSLEEFCQFCNELSLVNKTFGTRQQALCYQLALMMPSDAKRQPQMTYVEFLEAFARVVDYLEHPEPEKAIFSCAWDAELLERKLAPVLNELLRASRSSTSRRTLLQLDAKSQTSLTSSPRPPSNN